MVSARSLSGSTAAQRRTFTTLVAMFLGVQIVILLLAFGALNLTNLIRAYATGEGLYSKAHQQAVFRLQRYVDTGDPAHYADFLEYMQVPLGDRQARMAMEQEPPDRDAALEGFLQGRNHPDDAPGMITLYLWFKDTRLFAEPAAIWAQADELLQRLLANAAGLHAGIDDGGIDPARRQALMTDIYRIDREVTDLEIRFSQVLGDLAREIKNAAIILLGGASLLLWFGSLAFGVHLHRRSVAAEMALVEREGRLRTLMNSTADGILAIEADGRIESANRAAERMFERSGSLAGAPVDTLIAGEDREEFRAALAATRDGATARVGGREPVFTAVRGESGEFPMEATFSLEAGGGRLIATLRDITDRVSTEARLFQAQKMDVVGQLTGGVAHDFNNLLTVITGNLELLRDQPRNTAGARQLIDAAIGAAERGARVTSHLLAFSRKQSLKPTQVHIDTLVNGMRELLGQTVSGAIELDYRLEGRGWHAMADPVQLEAAILNLVLNARHATDDGGRIVVSSRQHYAGAGRQDDLDLAPGEYAVVSVSDTGVGIRPEDLDKVFDPFFTTREVGTGSGLGLSMVQGFVRQSGGQVRLRSTVGRGTTVELYLPRAEAARPHGATEAPQDFEPVEARILVIEDNPSLRDVAVRMLRLRGYDVEGVGDAPTALARIERGPAPDLLLCDIVLPAGMDGFEFARRANLLVPDIAIVLMSGYPRDSLANGRSGRFRLLQKPFSREQLTRTIAETLAERTNA